MMINPQRLKLPMSKHIYMVPKMLNFDCVCLKVCQCHYCLPELGKRSSLEDGRFSNSEESSDI